MKVNVKNVIIMLLTVLLVEVPIDNQIHQIVHVIPGFMIQEIQIVINVTINV